MGEGTCYGIWRWLNRGIQESSRCGLREREDGEDDVGIFNELFVRGDGIWDQDDDGTYDLPHPQT